MNSDRSLMIRDDVPNPRDDLSSPVDEEAARLEAFLNSPSVSSPSPFDIGHSQKKFGAGGINRTKSAPSELETSGFPSDSSTQENVPNPLVSMQTEGKRED